MDSDVLRGLDTRTQPDMAAQRGVPADQHGGDVRRLEFAVRWKECGEWEYSEWSCGCPRIYATAEAAQADANDLKDDLDIMPHLATAEVAVRTAAGEWATHA